MYYAKSSMNKYNVVNLLDETHPQAATQYDQGRCD